MVCSSLWRKAKKDAWPLVVALVLPNLLFGQIYATIGSYGVEYVYKNKGSISTTKKYSRKHGGFVATRTIQSEVYTDDKSREAFPNLGIGYHYNNFYPSLFYGPHISGLSIRHKWWFLKYGIDFTKMSMLNNVKVTNTISNYSCLVRCSYIQNLETETKDSKRIKKELEEFSLNIYFGGHIPFTDILFLDAGILVNPSSFRPMRKTFIALSVMNRAK